jgi:hypothetical protein
MRLPRLAGLLLAATLAAGCGLLTEPRPVFEQTNRGPSSDEVFVIRTYLRLGRQPSFDERRRFQDHLDDRVRRYLREHPEIEQSSRYSDIRFWHQVGEGSSRDEVRLLLDEPDETTGDAARMAQLAERFWPTLSARAKEAWVYPGWVLFFDDRGLTAFIKVLAPPPSSSLPAGRQ